MTKEETAKLFKLLGTIYPKAQEFSDKDAMLAWWLVLEPIAYDDVRAAALSWTRTNTYPPRASELAVGLMPVTPVDEQAPVVSHAWMDAASDAIDAKIEAMGGTCQILTQHSGVVGEVLLLHMPDGCDGCRRRDVSGCPHEEMVNEIRQRGRLSNGKTVESILAKKRGA